MPVLTLPSPLPKILITPVVPTPTNTYTALVGGSYVNVLAGSVNIQQQIGQRSTGSLKVYSALGVTWQYGTQCLIYDETGALVYGGYVSRDSAYRAPGARQGDRGYLEHDLTLMDNVYRADKRVAFRTYSNISAGAIVSDLLNGYLAAEGVIATSSSIAAGATIVKVVWNGNKTVADALRWLAEVSGYWWNIDAAGVLWFQPYGGISAPLAIDGSTIDSMQQVSVDFGNDLMVGKQYVKGSVAQTATLTETFVGDGLRRNFTLSYPLNTLVNVTLNGIGILSLVSTKGNSGKLFYTSVNDPIIAEDPAIAPLATTDTLVVTYIGQYPVLTSAQNPTGIAAQQARERTGSGIIESVYSDNKLRSLPAAFQMAANALAHFGSDVATLTFTTRSRGLAPGQLLPVSLSDFNLVNEQMLIASVTINDGTGNGVIWYTVVAVGSPSAQWAIETAQWQTLWHRLMAQSSDPSDYTDAQNTSLALLSSSVFSHMPSFKVTTSKVLCPIFSDATLFNDPTVFC
ncbi:MAG TPA: hypothetical protein VFN11_00780 [Ktedonobacterales bacterium]|nr:hypothetical protein [Ktedonobacterales bacterium]